MDSRVFIVNFAGHDYTDAERFGELCFVTKGYVSHGSLDRMLYEVAEGLKDSSPSDWLLISGLLLLNTLAAAYWINEHGSLRILVWDKKTRSYRPMEISDDQLDLLSLGHNDRELHSEASQSS